MIAKIRTFLTRGLLALCLASGLTAQTIEPAGAAPIAGMTSSPEAATANPVQQAYYYRYFRVHHRRPHYRHVYFYAPRRHYRPVYRYRPIYHVSCRRFVGWHQSRYGMVFGPYRRCYR